MARQLMATPPWRTAAPEWIALAAGVLPLAIAHAAQAGLLTGQRVVPCALCYVERWPYRVALLLALLGLVRPAWRRVVVPLLVAVFIAGAAIGFVHAGVEWGWWPSPLPECAAPVLNTGSIAAMLNSMPAHPAKPCDDPTYLVPGLPVSMAQLNMIYALAAAAVIAICAWRGPAARAGANP